MQVLEARLKEENGGRAARCYKSAAASKESRGDIVKFFENAEQCGRKPQQISTTMFFLIPKNVTSERPIALVPTLIRLVVRNIAQNGEIRLPRRRKKTTKQSRWCWIWIKHSERVSLPVVWATHFDLLSKILRVLCG